MFMGQLIPHPGLPSFFGTQYTFNKSCAYPVLPNLPKHYALVHNIWRINVNVLILLVQIAKENQSLACCSITWWKTLPRKRMILLMVWLSVGDFLWEWSRAANRGLGFYSHLHIDNLEAIEAILCNLSNSTLSFSHWTKLLNDTFM